MTTLDQYIAKRSDRDPAFAEALQESGVQIDFGLWVAHLRKVRGWTQKQLAEAVGMAQAAVARIERGGRMPSLYTAQRFARALNASVIINPTGHIRLADCDPSAPDVRVAASTDTADLPAIFEFGRNIRSDLRDAVRRQGVPGLAAARARVISGSVVLNMEMRPLDGGVVKRNRSDAILSATVAERSPELLELYG